MNNPTPQNTNDQHFDRDVLHADTPVLVDFWAEWCGPCHAIAPVLETVAEQYADTLAIKKLNVDSNPQAVSQYGIRSIPTLIVFKNGVAVETLTGLQSADAIKAVVERHTH